MSSLYGDSIFESKDIVKAEEKANEMCEAAAQEQEADAELEI